MIRDLDKLFSDVFIFILSFSHSSFFFLVFDSFSRTFKFYNKGRNPYDSN